MKLKWDDAEGIGAVPMARDGDYFGFLRKMSAQQFLDLNPRRRDRSVYVTEQLRQGAALGRPFLDVRRAPAGQWRVYGHEGRGRAQAIADVFGPETELEVWVFPRGERRRHLTPKDLLGALQPDPRRKGTYARTKAVKKRLKRRKAIREAVKQDRWLRRSAAFLDRPVPFPVKQRAPITTQEIDRAIEDLLAEAIRSRQIDELLRQLGVRD